MVLAGTIVAGASSTTGVEVDPTVGTFSGKNTGTLSVCSGEDGSPPDTYFKVVEVLKGMSVDSFTSAGGPILGDFSLSGVLKSKVTLTINKATGVGWGKGGLSISDAASGTVISGPVTVVVQADASFNIVARGLWEGTVAVGGVATGDIAVMNFELTGTASSASFTGFWGGAPWSGTAPGVGDLSVKTTKVTCP
jgi:hypothetical protein